MDQMSWSKPTSFEDVENFGILAGEDNGKKIFVGRAVDHDGNFVPAKVIPAKKTGFYYYNGAEEESNEVDFLDNASDYHWVKAADANMADAAVVSGSCIGRGKYNGNLVVGRVDTDKNVLVGWSDGKQVELPSYDVLIYKSKGVVYETIQKASNFSTQNSSKQFSSTQVFSSSTVNNGFNSGFKSGFTTTTVTDNSHLVMKIRQLELEKMSYQKERLSYEERLQNQQARINELSYEMKKLKIDNAQLSKDRFSFQERTTTEQTKFATMEEKLAQNQIDNAYLLKKITTLEEALQMEKLLIDSISEKYLSSDAFGKTLLTKITNFEESNRTLQNRVFELESEISMSTSNSESMLKRLADNEALIKSLRLQLETLLKKLELSRHDNDFLVEKLRMLTETLRTYQSQIACLTNKLQEAKTVIATNHADLARANAQIAKYQAAISSCYILNGELMTKVSAMNVAAQNQVGSDCSFNLVNYASTGFSVGQSLKAVGYGKTSTLLELTGSDMNFSYEGTNYEPFVPHGTEPLSPHARGGEFVGIVPLGGFEPHTMNNGSNVSGSTD